MIENNPKTAKKATVPTRESIKKNIPLKPDMESQVAKQNLAQKISEYAGLESTGERLKFIQENLDETKTGKGTLTNQLAYIFPKTANHDRDQLTAALKQSNDQLFNSHNFDIQINNDISTGRYQFVRSFHLLGRHDEKDLFKVVLQWPLLTNQLHVSHYSSDREIAEQLDRLNRYIDGTSSKSTSITDLQKQLDQVQGSLDLLNDLNSNDKNKIKEAKRYEDEFLKGAVLVQSLHEQGTYEPVESIKKRAFDDSYAVQLPDDEYTDFIQDLRQLPGNQVKDGGMFTRERPRNRYETIQALFDQALETAPVKHDLEQTKNNLIRQIENAKTQQAQAAQAESSAVEMVKQKQESLIKQVKTDLQTALSGLANKDAINKIDIQVKY